MFKPKVLGGICLAAVVLFSTVFGAPKDGPSLENIAGSTRDASFSESITMEAVLSVTDWEINRYGPVSHAKGTPPFTEVT